MEQFRNINVILVSLLLCFGFSEAQITQWGGGDGTAPAAGANANLTQTVAEDLAVGATVLTVTATAATAKGQFTVATQTNTGQLEVDGGTGAVTLSTGQSFDRETTAFVVMEITVTDTSGGGVVTTGTATVSITVTDVNEFTPTFTNPSSPTVWVIVCDTSTAAVYTVAATDDDAGTTEKVITYSIDSGNTDSDLTIGGSSGAITVNNALAKDRTPSYALVVHATDAGADAAFKTGTATIIVIVDGGCSSEDSGAGSNTIDFITLTSSALLSLYALL